MFRIIDSYMNLIYRVGAWEWFGVLIAVLLFGLFCMRGYGSRKEY
jgi:hypothetical protein